ncbi:MAG TPA: nucleoside-diphosphate sugar epimerase/dehydratase [Bacilli bacterium]
MNHAVRKLTLILIDIVLIVFSVCMAYFLRFDFRVREPYFRLIPYVVMSLSFVTVCSFHLFKVYRRIWRYAGINDLLAIVKASLLAVFVFFVAHHYIIHTYLPDMIVPRSIYPLAAIMIAMTSGGIRLLWRIWAESTGRIQPHNRRTLIIGAGEAGRMVVKELRQTQSELYPIAFIDDDEYKFNHEILGVPVLGNRGDIPKIAENYNIEDIIVAMPSASRSEIAEVIEIAKRTNCQIKILPRMEDLLNGKLTVNSIRNVSVEDLLGRDPVKVDLDGISDYLRGQVVLVTGAGGSIGSELCRQISGFRPEKLLLLGHGENSIYEIELELRRKFPELSLEPVIADIQDKARIRQVFAQYRPAVVFHAAAHKHVPLMEKNPAEAVKNNVFGTKNVAECAREFRARRFVLISTDKAVNPTSVMGACKRVAEMIVQSLNTGGGTKFAAVRFGNVLGSRGSVIPLFKKQIEAGGPVTVTHPDMIRYFMTIPEAVQLVIQAGALAEGGEVFILDMGKPVKIDDLAKDLIRLSGLEPGKDINITYTGMRPGEKLFEEILSKEEGAAATKHDRIYVGKPLEISPDELQAALLELNRSLSEANPADDKDAIGVRRALKQIVASYKWQEKGGAPPRASVDEAFRASLEVLAALDHKTT